MGTIWGQAFDDGDVTGDFLSMGASEVIDFAASPAPVNYGMYVTAPDGTTSYVASWTYTATTPGAYRFRLTASVSWASGSTALPLLSAVIMYVNSAEVARLTSTVYRAYMHYDSTALGTSAELPANYQTNMPRTKYFDARSPSSSWTLGWGCTSGERIAMWLTPDPMHPPSFPPTVSSGNTWIKYDGYTVASGESFGLVDA